MKKVLLLASAVAMLAAGEASAQSHHGGGGGGGGAHFSGGARGSSGGGFGGSRSQGAQSSSYRGGSAQSYRGGANYRQDYRAGDWNHNGVVDRRFDRNGNGVVDRRFDRNGNGNIDRRFDRNRNGVFDRRYGGWNQWRGGRGPWLSDHNWFRNNWRFNSPYRWYGSAYRWPYGFGYRSWYYGEILPGAFFLDNYFINDWGYYGLYEPPYGYQWIRVGGDILLVDPVSGRIMQVVNGAFAY